ncbi:MAG: MFS transporter [Nanoarchaeota archaeon]|nr:MFS transporter [Nanoarchaeota archaeon]
MFKKRGFPVFTQVNKIALIGFISGLALASVGAIWAIYLESILKNPAYVGYLISFFSIISLASYFFIIPIVEKQSKTKLYLLSLTLYFFSLILFTFLKNIYLIIILGILISVVVSLRITSFGLIVSDKSKKRELSKNEGLVYTFSNLAWVIGPLIAGFVSSKYGLNMVFAVAALFFLISIILFRNFRVIDNRVEKKVDGNLLKVLFDFFKNKNRVFCYILSGGVNFWWALIYIYVPILIVDSGYSSSEVGYFLFAAVFPLLSFEYFFGKIAGRTGFKKIFFMGYLIMGILGILCFFTDSLFFILAFLVLASVGASMVESTTEAYFFDIVPAKQKDKYYGPYNTTIDVNYTIASFLGAVILSFLAFKFVFLLFGFVMIFISFISLSIKEIVEDKK